MVAISYILAMLVGIPLYIAFRGRVGQGPLWPILAGLVVAMCFPLSSSPLRF